MTLKEIAQEAGVSISTVSRVINKQSATAASKEVQDRIWEIVRRTGYTPNISARSLKQGGGRAHGTATHSIACLFARTSISWDDPFFATLARSIEEEAFRHNYVLKYSFTAIDIHSPNTFQLIADNHVDGVAVLGRCDKQTLSFLKKYFKYVVYTGLNRLDAKYDQIICDGYQASLSAVRYLLELGHKQIAYIGETENETRFTGYRDALSEAHIPFDRQLISNVPLSPEGGYSGAKMLLERKSTFTALFTSNDITAIGVMRALHEAGKKLPEDISVISIDDISTAQYLSPMLTSVHIPLEEMGKLAAKTLIDRIEGGHLLPLHITVPFHVVKRESCAPIKMK